MDDAAAKERTVQRRLFTIAGNNLEEILKSGQAKEYQIRSELKKLSELMTTIHHLDQSIKKALLEKDCSEEMLEKEIVGALKYKERYIDIETKLEIILKTVKKENEKDEPKRNFKLPEIKQKRFDGNIKNWLPFWGQFKKIDSDPSIEKTDKLQYLSQSMESDTEVKNFVDSFPLSHESYDLCLAELKSRYAREELLVQIYVRELLSLILNKDKNVDLTTLYDSISSHLRSLEVLNVTKEKYSAFLMPMVESALPTDILKIWERTKPVDVKDELDLLLLFLKKEVESNQRISLANNFRIKPSESARTEPTAACFMVSSTTKKTTQLKSCIWCEKETHSSVECYKLAKMTLEERRNHLNKANACTICLRKGHYFKKCKAFIKCHICGRRHTVAMCPGKIESNTSKEDRQEEKEKPAIQNYASQIPSKSQTTTLLQTVAVQICIGEKSTVVRALFDSGSQRSYVKEDIMKNLGATPASTEELSHSLFGGNTVSLKNYNSYDLNVKSIDNSFVINMKALGQTTICKNVPKVDIKNDSLSELLQTNQIKLTDTDSGCSDIGLLIGADYSGLLLTNTFIQLKTGLTAIKTNLGWTLQGKTQDVIVNTTHSHTNIVSSLFCSQIIPDFWNLEILGIQDPVQVQSKQQKEEEVLKSFEESIQINNEGRYEVQLPWKSGHDDLLSNRGLAIRRLQSATNKLLICNKFKDYDNILNEWEHAGIIENVPAPDPNKDQIHYLPHRPVAKETSLTTKLRPVFDASAKDKKGKSLNACLEKGMNFIDKIPDLLIGFRKGCIGISADIAKAFLQISIKPDDRDYLRFFWWDSEARQEIKEYRHCRVVFGITSSPFLLSATIQHHLENIKGKQKNTANILASSFYVDNLITSLDTEIAVENFIQEAKEIMQEAKFDLRQWVTSPLNINETNETVISVLGLMWDTVTDELYCNLNTLPLPSQMEKINKRYLLSLTQRIFDPVGILCPVTLVPRLLLQKIWNKKIDWDEDLPTEIESQFNEWYNNIHLLKNCRLPRKLSDVALQGCTTSLHMFCDASKDGYAACVFIRTEDSRGKVTVRLLSAKSRISPPEKVTIPRLELLAALMGSRLIKMVREKLQQSTYEEYCWSDSGVTICWIKRELHWNTYVGNRVKEIRKNTNVNNWHHIPGNENWADLPSRGCSPRQLLETRWWEGPPWLLRRPDQWPQSTLVVDEREACKELKKTACVNTCCEDEHVKTPAVLPAKNTIVRKMVQQRHEQLLHAGTNMVIADLRKRFWIIGIRNLVKSIIDKCIICRRHRSKPTQVQTAPLPIERVQPGAPFGVTGVDLAGPMYLRGGEKCWIVVYTCAVYRAVHLELTQSLSTEAFIRTLRRFVARRGRVNLIISDNGTNFVGTKNLLASVDWDEVQRQSTIMRIKWKLNAPTAAWWGGFFERMIKIIKNLLRRVLGMSSVSYEEMETLLCDCEAVVNDRPLTYVEGDNSYSLEPLTPACFLQALPESQVTDIDIIDAASLNRRLKYLQKLREDFRLRFKNEYLTELVQRGREKNGSIKVGDIVLVESEEKRVKWPLGLVIDIFTGRDGVNRTAKVKTTGGYKIRPFQRLYQLELFSSEVERRQSSGAEGSIDTLGKKFNVIVNPSSTIIFKKAAAEPTNTVTADTENVVRATRLGRVIKMPSKFNI